MTSWVNGGGFADQFDASVVQSSVEPCKEGLCGLVRTASGSIVKVRPPCSLGC